MDLTEKQAAKPYLGALTGLRFFAALYVVIFHTYPSWRMEGLVHSQWLWNTISAGYLGVSFFFILSGFIIGYTYEELKTQQRWTFWSARFIRIYPSYFLSILPGLLGWVAIAISSSEANFNFYFAAFMALVLCQSWHPATARMWNTPAWSLSVEAFFYLLFPFFAPFFARLKKPSHILPLLVVVYVLGLSETFLYLAYNPIEYYLAATPSNQGLSGTLIKFHPLMHLHEFAVGLLFCRLYLNRSERSNGYQRAGASLQWLCIGSIAGAILFSSEIPYFLLHNGLLSLIMGFLLVLLAEFPRTGLARVLASPVFVLLGDASYALYIFHVVIRTGLGEFYTVHFDTRPVRTGCLYMVGCVLFSVLYYSTVEKYFQTLGRRVLKRVSTPRATG
ncbi:MAG: acyltransferase [Bdellovibrionota bacterium]